MLLMRQWLSADYKGELTILFVILCGFMLSNSRFSHFLAARIVHLGESSRL